MSDVVQKSRDAAIAAAKDVPTLIAGLETADPAMAQAITGKALAASKSVYGGIAVLMVTWLASKFNLGWGADTITLVAGGLVLTWLRMVTFAPIAGLFRVPAVPAPVPATQGATP